VFPSLGDPRLDAAMPGGEGLPLGCWHEVGGKGLETELCAATAAFGARLLSAAAGGGEVVWVLRRADLYAPGLVPFGVDPARLTVVQTRTDSEAAAAFEDALASPGVAAAIAEIERLDLVTGRRWQLACERRRSTGIVLRRRPYGRSLSQKRDRDPSTAVTRWRVSPAPSDPGEAPGLGPERWRAVLERSRGGRTGSWILEAQNGAYPFRVAAELAGGEPAAATEGGGGVRRAVG
jgi:protein ImuA